MIAEKGNLSKKRNCDKIRRSSNSDVMTELVYLDRETVAVAVVAPVVGRLVACIVGSVVLAAVE